MPKSNKILTHKDQDSEYDKQRTNMGVRSGPRIPSESREEGGLLLIHSDTTDGSTAFVDSSTSNHTITTGGAVHHDSANGISKFGATSIYFDGSGDFLEIESSSNWQFTGDFTVDLWIYPQKTSSGANLVGDYYIGGATTSPDWQFLYNADSQRVQFWRGSVVANSSTDSVPRNQWTHVALVRSGSASNNCKIYINGALDGQGTFTTTVGRGLNLWVGIDGNEVAEPYLGYMDEIRISNTARFSGTFRPPHRPYFTRNLLLCLDAMNAKSFAGEPATNLKGNEDFSTMSGYTGLDLVQVAESQSPSGYACRMTINSSLSNGAARSRFGSAGSIPTSGSGFVSVYVKGNSSTESNGLRPSVFAGSSWVTLLPLDGGPNHITQEYRKFGAAVTFGTGSGGPNPGFSMVQVVLGAAAPPGARTFWIKPMVTTKDHSVPFTSGTRSSTDSWRDISGNGKHADHTSTDFGDSGDIELRQNGKILLPTDAADITASINFDGTNDYMLVSSHSDKFSAWTPSGSYNNNLTIEVWVKTSDDGANIVSKPWNGSGVYNYRVISNGTFVIHTNTTASVNVGSLTTGQWVHFVGVITPTHLYGYVNGELKDDTSHSLTNTISSGEQNVGLLIGSLYPYGASWSGNTNFSLDGQIAAVKIYSAALSHADVRQSYNALKSRFRL